MMSAQRETTRTPLSLARAAVLSLAQAEITGEATMLQRARTVAALRDAGMVDRYMLGQIALGYIATRGLLAIALACTPMVTCSCGLVITGADWVHADVVVTRPGYESRRCHCGAVHEIEIPPMRGVGE